MQLTMTANAIEVTFTLYIDLVWSVHIIMKASVTVGHDYLHTKYMN